LLTGPGAEVEKRLPEAGALIANGAELVDDHEGSAEYKRHLIGVFLRRAFLKAVASDRR
jgi:CO/xanthine dehydrogenase FAD-binding subunit